MIITGKLSFEDHVDYVKTLLSAYVLVKTVVKSGPSNIPVTHGLCGLDIVPYYLCTPSLWRAPHQAATRTPVCFS